MAININESDASFKLPNMDLLYASDPEKRGILLRNYVDRIMHTPYGTSFDLFSPLEVNGVFISNGAFLIAVFSIEKIDAERCGSLVMDDIYEKAAGLISENLSSHNINYIFEINGLITVIICYYRASQDAGGDFCALVKNAISETYNSILAEAAEKHGIYLNGYMSELFFGPSNLPFVFDRLYSTWEYDQYMGEKPSPPSVCVIGTDEGEGSNYLDLFSERIKRLCERIMLGTFEEAMPEFEELFGLIVHMRPRTVEAMRIRLQSFMILFLNDLVICEMITPEDPSLSELSSCIYTAGNGRELREEIFSRVEALIRCKTQRQAIQSETLIDDVKSYIHEYSGDPTLSIAKLADLFKISVPKLSSRFKQATGEKLIDHIHQARIEKAIKLLRTTEMPLKEISDEVGYGNISTMYRAFQRYRDVSPSQFRQNG